MLVDEAVHLVLLVVHVPGRRHRVHGAEDIAGEEEEHGEAKAGAAARI